MPRSIKALARPLYSFLLRPSFRCSYSFVELQQLLSYTPQEKTLSDAMDFAKWSELDGDYLEFGVYEGRRLASAFHLARRNGMKKMRFHAFDSFQGLPAPTGVDAEGFKQFDQGEYAADVQRFRDNVMRSGVDLEKMSVVPGWFNDTLNDETKSRIRLESAAVVWVDCDLYESTVPVLEFLTDVVGDGTVIIFDDWFCFRGDPGRGEQRAFSEWLDRNPDITASEFHKFGWHGNSFILHRPDA